MARVPRALLLALALAACGPSPSASDGGMDGGAERDGGIAAPEIPWLAEGVPPLALTPCPDGWRGVTGEGATTCDAFPEGGGVDCPPGQAHFAGEPGCAPVGPTCPIDGRVADLPSDRAVVHVLAGASGDGTASTPYGSLSEFSWGGLGRGTIVAVGRGRYEAAIRLPAGIALWGACVTDTVLVSAVPSDSDGVVTVVGAETEVRGLGIGPAARIGVAAGRPGSSVRLDGVWIESADSFGILVRDHASVVANALVVRSTQPRSDGNFGRALHLDSAARADVSRAVLDDNRDVGVFLADDGTTLQISDAVIRDTGSRQLDSSLGRGLVAQLGAQLEVSRALLESNREAAVYVSGNGTSALLWDVVVRDTLSRQSDALLGRGLDVQEGGHGEVVRGWFEHNRDVGVIVTGDGSSLLLSDVVVRDTQGRESDGTFGRGLSVRLGGQAEVSRALFAHNRDVAVGVAEPGSIARLSDVVVRDTQESGGSFGRGLDVALGARAEVSRALLENNREICVFSGGAASLQLSDVVIRDTQSREVDGAAGRGLNVQSGAEAEVVRALLEHNRELSVIAVNTDTLVRLSDVVIQDTLPSACGSDGRCPGRAFGTGVVSSLEASLSLSDFAIRRAPLCGAHLAIGGDMDLSDGEVSDSAIGVCVQREGYDITRLTEMVRFVDNETNLQATDLPVPEPSVPTGE